MAKYVQRWVDVCHHCSSLLCTLQAYLIGVVWACYKYLGSHQVRTASGNRTYGSDSPATDDTEVRAAAAQAKFSPKWHF